MASSGLGWEVFAKYQVNAGVPQGSILDSVTFLLNILMTFLMMLSVMVLSMLMILFSTLSVRRHLICGKLELALELASVLRDTLEWDIKLIVVSIVKKTELASFSGLVTLVLLIWKRINLFLNINHHLRWWWSLLNLSGLFFEWTFFLLGLLFISVNLHSCHVWTGSPCCYFDLSDKPWKLIYRIVRPLLAAFLDCFTDCWNTTKVNRLYSYYFSINSSKAAELVSFHFSVSIPRCCKDGFVNNFFP